MGGNRLTAGGRPHPEHPGPYFISVAQRHTQAHTHRHTGIHQNRKGAMVEGLWLLRFGCDVRVRCVGCHWRDVWRGVWRLASRADHCPGAGTLCQPATVSVPDGKTNRRSTSNKTKNERATSPTRVSVTTPTGERSTITSIVAINRARCRTPGQQHQ